jgi:hypothetical protein
MDSNAQWFKECSFLARARFEKPANLKGVAPYGTQQFRSQCARENGGVAIAAGIRRPRQLKRPFVRDLSHLFHGPRRLC